MHNVATGGKPREELPAAAQPRDATLPGFSRSFAATAVIVLVCWLSVAPNAAAAEVYRWIDEHGQVQFGDRPPAPGAEAITIDPPPLAGDGSGARHQNNQRRLESYAADRAEKKAQQAQAAKEKKQRAANCEKARRNKFRFDHAPRVARRDKDGNYHVLDGAEYDAAKARYEEMVKRWCEGP